MGVEWLINGGYYLPTNGDDPLSSSCLSSRKRPQLRWPKTPAHSVLVMGRFMCLENRQTLGKRHDNPRLKQLPPPPKKKKKWHGTTRKHKKLLSRCLSLTYFLLKEKPVDLFFWTRWSLEIRRWTGESLPRWWFQPIWNILVKLDHFPR